MENMSFGRDFGTVTALYDFIIFCIGDFLKWGYPNSWMVSNGKKTTQYPMDDFIFIGNLHMN
jgi:hypothetical protein